MILTCSSASKIHLAYKFIVLMSEHGRDNPRYARTGIIQYFNNFLFMSPWRGFFFLIENLTDFIYDNKMETNTSLVKSMKIETPEPPALQRISSIPPSISVIWVLDEVLPKYLVHPVWKYFAPIIKPLSMRTEKRISYVSFIIGKWDFEIDKEIWQ